MNASGFVSEQVFGDHGHSCSVAAVWYPQHFLLPSYSTYLSFVSALMFSGWDETSARHLGSVPKGWGKLVGHPPFSFPARTLSSWEGPCWRGAKPAWETE